jgi:HK97 family phage major capsid protein
MSDTRPLIEQLRERRDQAAGLLNKVKREIDTLPASEAREVRGMLNEREQHVLELTARIGELAEQEVRESAAAAHRVQTGTWGSAAHTFGREVYGPSEPVSYFRDLVNSKRGDMAAMERLNVNNDVVARETRAGDMTTVAGAGGTFAPPLWLSADFAALARPGRVTADLLNKQELPSGVSSINLPKVSSGAATGVTVTQNTTITDVAMTTTSISSSISTISGKQVVSLELIQMSGVPFDKVILGDLAADYAKQLNTQVISGTGANGQLNGLLQVGTNTTFTTASPAFISSTAANSYYNKVLSAIAAVSNTRYAPATHLVMTPTRWAWCLEALDGNQRVQISPAQPGAAWNAPAISTDPLAAGSVGQLAGLPVFTDPLVPVNLGGGTNEDRTFVLRADDLWLYETPIRLESWDSTYADSNAVLFRALAWSAAIFNRYTASTNYLSGTGCISPTL